ncbi:MAG TPA: LysR family transcriptional regulator [Acidimicrobiales bacterium]|jgi:DNA-binding transcriptional LysR family regulator|nr:LysR family transcriptional regulator [Acidimicrobiales bacterium]
MIDVRRLVVLQELDRQGTVNAAAGTLHLTPSAVSQQLAALSREVGCQVTEKDGRNLRITPAGKVLLGHADEIVAQMEAMKGDLERHHLGEVGVVRIGAFQTASRQIVVPAAARLATTHERLEVDLSQIDAPQSLQELAAGRLDIALSVEYVDSPPTTDPRFSRLPLLQDEFRALLPARHRLAAKRSIALADLRDEQWIGSLPGSPCHFVTMSACAAAGFAPRVRHQIDDWAITVDLVGAGLGVGLIPGLAFPAPRPDVAIVPLAGRPAARNIVAFTRRGTEESPTIGRVLAAMHESCRDVGPR